jgi:hypothetical protein
MTPASPSPSTSSHGKRTPARVAKGTQPTASTPARRGYAPAARKGKFNANGEHIDGIWFASEAEAERYRQLKDMQEAGTIANLRTQVTYDLVVNNVRICGYRADFTYLVIDDVGRELRAVVEDVKGMVTPEFTLKHRLYDALMPVPLSVILVKGEARHSVRPKLSDKTGKPVRSRAGWIDLHWKNRIPE